MAAVSPGVILGLFHRPEQLADALDALRRAGLVERGVQVLSGAPYPEGTFGEEPEKHRLGVYPLVGAALGAVFGLVVSIGTQLAYPLPTGGMPILAIPPVVNMVFETTMIGAVTLTFLGSLIESRLPDFSPKVYDPRISEGYVGLLVHLADGRAAATERMLREAGAVDIVGGGGDEQDG